MRKRKHFIKLIQLWGVILLIGIGVTVVAIDVISSYRDFNFRADKMRSDYITHQKQMIKQEVNRVVDLILYEKAQSEMLTKQKIKSRVYEAYSIAHNIYLQNNTIKSETEIKQMILDALRPIRFEQGSGYYFATRLDGIEILFADKPEMEGLNLLDVHDTRGKYVVKDMIEIARQSGEGFYEYHWTKPGSKRNDFKKISFIKRFEPYDWFIGTGLYVDDVERQIKVNLLSTISRIRFGKEGYIFVNRLNGDALVSNGKLVSGTKKLWEVFNKNPEKTKALFEKEYNAALKPDGDYIYYSLIKLSSPDIESPKTSFIYGIPELQWLVGAGVYLDDVDTDIALMQTELNNQVKSKMIYFILTVIGIVAIFFLFFNWLNRGLKSDFNLFVSFFKRAAHSDEKIDRKTIKFVELDQMAEYANRMLTDRTKTEKTLREREERLRAIFEAAKKVALIITDAQDPEPKVLEFSRGAEEIFGYSKTEMVENPVSILHLPNNVAMFSKAHKRMKEGKIGFSGETTLVRKSGETFPALFTTYPLLDEKGKMYAALDVGIDISEQKDLEIQLRQAHKMESIGTLAGGIAHDFNNILGIIIGNAELAMDDVIEKDPARQNLEEIRTAGLRAKDVVRQLLSFARKTKLEKQPTNIIPIVEESLKLLRSSIPASIEIRQNIPKDIDTIMADPTQINQVLINLCTNADHAIQDEGVINVTLRNVEFDKNTAAKYPELNPGRYVNLAVSDTGQGMPREDIDRIFDPYFTTKDVGKGTGMGLAVVHGIVKEHHGIVTVESELRKGTTFNIFFPVVEKEAVAKIKTDDKLPAGDERILFIDDEESIAKMSHQRLERLGYKVKVMTNPIEALELFRSSPDQFDLVITDMTMPEMTGDKLVKEILNIRSDIPVILCTGFSERIDEKIAKNIGASGYIEKPLDKHDFAFKVRRVLDGR